jgi:beta-carotene 3-hydroxylase
MRHDILALREGSVLLVIIATVALTIAIAVFMEFVAWSTHKYIMHGFLWILHEDHHRPRHHGFQKNDLFTIFFALWAVGLFLGGRHSGSPLLYGAGTGVTLYGLGYFLFHDVMFHKRIRRLKLRAWTPYLQRIVHAHKVHHQTSGQEWGKAFGFLYASSKYNVRDS